MEFNREQIIKAMECCKHYEFYKKCKECVFSRWKKPTCRDALNAQALRLYRKLIEERDQLDLTLAGVMLSVDKWLEGDELEQDEVKRAIAMREKTLQIVEKLTEENERLHAQVEQSEITIKDLRSRNHELTRANMSLSKYADELQLELAECVQIKADTVHKMQERLKEAPIKVGLPLFGLHTKDEIEDYANGLILQMRDVIDQIAKELLEDNT